MRKQLGGAFSTIARHGRLRSAKRKVAQKLKSLLPSSLASGLGAFIFFGEHWHKPMLYSIAVVVVAVLTRAFVKKLVLSRRIRTARRLMESRDQRQSLPAPNKWKDYPVSDEVRKSVDAARQDSREFVLARIDMSGRAYCEFGELPFLPSVSSEDFEVRDRYDIDIVICDDLVLLRKDYRGDTDACVREWFNMEPLVGKARVPVVRRIDVEKTVTHMDFVYGRTVLEILRDRGALMRDADIARDPAFTGLDGEERQRKLDERGTPLLSACFPEIFFQELENLIRTAHACRLTDLDIRFANVLVDKDNMPWLIDFHEANIFPRWADWLFRFKCHGDEMNYQRVFGRSVTV